MCEKPQRYSTELTHEYHMKYRNLPGKNEPFPPFVQYLPKMRGPFYPNDKEMVAKTVDCVAWSAFPGLLNGLLMVNDQTSFRGPLKNTLPTMAEVFFTHATPWVISGAVFGLVTSGSANYRKKEDYINYMLGGASAGSVFGLWYKNRLMSLWGTLIVGGIAGSYKFMKDNDYLTPGEIRRPRLFNMYRRTWFTDPIPVEGSDDDEYKPYRP